MVALKSIHARVVGSRLTGFRDAIGAWGARRSRHHGVCLALGAEGMLRNFPKGFLRVKPSIARRGPQAVASVAILPRLKARSLVSTTYRRDNQAMLSAH